jgi:hypothetical protein
MSNESWLKSTFSTGDWITLGFGCVGMLAAFFALQGKAALNEASIQRNAVKMAEVEIRADKKVDEVKAAVKDAEQRLRNEIQASEARQQQQIKNMNDETNRKLEQILERMN